MYKEAFAYMRCQFTSIKAPIRVGYAFWQPWMKAYHGEWRINSWSYGALYAHVWIDQDLKDEMTTGRR
jgi:hypothetical protein